MMRILERFMRTRNLLAAMILLQVLWLAATWLTGAASNWKKIPLLLLYSVVIGVPVFLMPVGLVSKSRQFTERFVQNEKLLLLTLCVVVLIAGVVYANHQGVWGYDEECDFVASRIVAMEGVAPFFAGYVQIPWLGRQHPPLIPLVNGFAMHVLGVELLVIRLVALAFATATLLITYFLGRELYDRNTGFRAALLLLSFPLFLRQGSAAMTDIPATFFFSLALLLTLHLLRKPTYRLSVATGIAIGAGLLSKYTMVLIYPVLLSCFATSGPFRRLKLHLGTITVVSVGMLATWLVYAYYIGVFAGQRDTIISYAGLVTTTNYGKRVLLESLLTRLPSAVGVYNIPLLFLGGLHLMRRRNQSDLFVLLWIVTVSLLLILTLPDHRYFMPTFPALAILMACGLRRIPEAAGQMVLLALLYCGGALYLFVDWHRARHLFLR
jgi:4-amino-4-deoxy-L-arabinose transferase-like glycosyltransferase